MEDNKKKRRGFFFWRRKKNNLNGFEATGNGAQENGEESQNGKSNSFNESIQSKKNKVNSTSGDNMRSPYEIGLYFGLKNLIKDKDSYAQKIKQEIKDIELDAANHYKNIKSYFDQLIDLTNKAKSHLKDSLKEIYDFQNDGSNNLRKTLVSTEIIGIASEKKGEIADKIVASYLDSLNKMGKSIDDYFNQINSIVKNINDLKVGNEIHQKYIATMDTLRKKEEYIQDLEKGFAFGLSLMKNLE